jgi:hypothetical protein
MFIVDLASALLPNILLAAIGLILIWQSRTLNRVRKQSDEQTRMLKDQISRLTTLAEKQASELEAVTTKRQYQIGPDLHLFAEPVYSAGLLELCLINKGGRISRVALASADTELMFNGDVIDAQESIELVAFSRHFDPDSLKFEFVLDFQDEDGELGRQSYHFNDNWLSRCEWVDYRISRIVGQNGSRDTGTLIPAGEAVTGRA